MTINLNINMSHRTFANINIHDKFFDSLRNDYLGFNDWYVGKQDQDAYVQYNTNGDIEGFLYMKLEYNTVSDITPPIITDKILKIGTFKIDAHGTLLGERFIKIILDYAISENVNVCYVTIFPKHKSLIKLIEKFGFKKYGVKEHDSCSEWVFLKNMRNITGDINKDYPLINIQGGKKYLLSIYPKYHSILFPDSILINEDKNILKDVSHTNSIHKIYVSSMDNIEHLKYGDTLVIYRTAPDGKSAEYTAVATSICVVQEIKDQNAFTNFEEFFNYACRYSVFNRDDLRYWYKRGGCKAIKLTYNIALNKRIVRHDLIEKIGLKREIYWGFFELSTKEFAEIVNLGQINQDVIRN